MSSSSDRDTPPSPPDQGGNTPGGQGTRGEKSKSAARARSTWGEAKKRFSSFTKSTSDASKKKLFEEEKLTDEEEQLLREIMFPILLPKLFQKEEHQVAQSEKLARAKARFDEIPVVDLQKTASSLNSELDLANIEDLSSDLDYLDMSEDYAGECDDTFDGGSTSGRSSLFSKNGSDTTMSVPSQKSSEPGLLSTSAFLGPLPDMDTLDLFLAKQVNESQIINVSTDDSILDVSRGQTSDQSVMEL